MKNMQEIDRAIRTVEAKVARLKAAAEERQTRIREKIAGLHEFAASDEATDVQRLAIRKALAEIEASAENVMPPLEEIEKEVDRIYGDQSLNSTYYFSRRNLKSAAQEDGPKRDVKVAAFLRQGETMEIPWTEMSYDQIVEVVDDIYGNQSDNATYYFSRAKTAVHMIEASMSGRTEMTLEEVMKQIDSLYGDQSKNETFYLSRRYDARESADWQGDEQHYLMSDDFDDSGHQRMSGGYEIPGYFAEDNFVDHNVVAPTYRVDNTLTTFGYGGDDVDEMPSIVENRVPRTANTFHGLNLDKYGIRMEKTPKGTMLMWDAHPMLSTDRAVIHGHEEPYTVVFYKGRQEVVRYQRLQLKSLIRILKDHMGLSLKRKAEVKTAGEMNPVAKIIYQQMGGRRLNAMLGVTQYINRPNGLGFKWPNKQRSRGNFVEIDLNGKDLYDMTFFNVSMRGKKQVAKYTDVYAENLISVFEDQTGFYLRLSSQRTAALSGADMKVLKAFLDQRPMEGKLLMTDGVKLDKMGMGGRTMAEWVRGKVEVTDETHVRSDETILRALKKHTPSKLLITSPTL